MTLREALRDDLVAMEAGPICRLPHLDLSGRQIFYFEPQRHTRQGYTSESMVSVAYLGPILFQFLEFDLTFLLLLLVARRHVLFGT